MTFGTSCEASDDAVQNGRERTKDRPRKEKKPSKGCFERIIELCTVRDRSCAELHERLARDGYEAGIVEESVNRAVSCGLVDDMRFADGFVRGRVSAGKGAVAITKDLEKHGIDPAVLPDWPDGYGLDEQSQVSRAVDFLEARPPTAKDKWAGAYRKLVTRGYSQGVASRAARLWAESQPY